MESDEYGERLKRCSSLAELMQLWVGKAIKEFKEVFRDGQPLKIDHANTLFIQDGIVDQTAWNLVPPGKRILFLLKEAYSYNDTKCWSLTNALAKGDWRGSTWSRVAEWTYGILNASLENGVASYSGVPFNDRVQLHKLLKNIAVVNIKKSNGRSESIDEELLKYAEYDKEEIKKEISLINPDIIVCGGTGYALDVIYGNSIRQPWNYDWFYITNQISPGKDVIIIDYYHPAIHWAAQTNYYAVLGIYYQAIKAQDFKAQNKDNNVCIA